jgi:protein disulfide-isomerase A1
LAEVKDVASKKLAVLLYTAADNTDTLKAFNALASSFDDIPFFFTHNSEVQAEYGVTTASALLVFRDFDDGMKVLANDSLANEDMKNFLNSVRFPLVMPFEQQAAERIFGSESPAIFVFCEESESPATIAFKAAAKANQNTGLTWSQSTITSGLGARLSEFLGVTAADANTVRIIKFVGGNLLKYKLVDVTVESVTQFVSDYKNDKLEAYFKSEAVPAQNAEPVRVVVGNNFKEVVLGEEWVLLEAYAPWCGHCKKLDPIYNELAAKLAHNKDLIIAKMDATANEHPSLNVKGFPTIKFYKKGEKTAPVDYSGERTYEGFVAFLEKELGRNLTEGASAVETEL